VPLLLCSILLPSNADYASIAISGDGLITSVEDCDVVLYLYVEAFGHGFCSEIKRSTLKAGFVYTKAKRCRYDVLVNIDV
jgi:hypothetical protein